MSHMTSRCDIMALPYGWRIWKLSSWIAQPQKPRNWHQDQCSMASGSRDNDMQFWCHTWRHAVTSRRYLMTDASESCLVELSNLKNPEIDTNINVLWHLGVDIMICNFDVTHDVTLWRHGVTLWLTHLKVV